MPWSWFGVKTLYRSEAHGKPVSTDADYRADATLVEERVILVRARSFDEAITKGEKEAINYALSCPRTNPYGQQVRDRFLGTLDAYQMFDPPGRMVEVFSSTSIVSSAKTDANLLRNRMPKESAALRRTRMNFLDRKFSGTR